MGAPQAGSLSLLGLRGPLGFIGPQGFMAPQGSRGSEVMAWMRRSNRLRPANKSPARAGREVYPFKQV